MVTISKVDSVTEKQWNLVKEIFPYPEIKEAQRRFIEKVLITRNPLLISARTGVGKTAALLTSLLSLKKPKEKIIIFVRTKAQINVYIRELMLIYRKMLSNWEKVQDHFKHLPFTLTILGKNELCVRAKQHYPGEMYTHICTLTKCSLKEQTKMVQPEELKKIARQFYKLYSTMITKEDLLSVYNSRKYCPYYVNFTLAQNADIIITSYPFLENIILFSYLFRRLHIDLSDCLIAVDEAHNLFQIMNVEITETTLINAIKEYKHPIFEDLLQQVQKEQVFEYKLDKKELVEFEKSILAFLNRQYKQGDIRSVNAYTAYHFIKAGEKRKIISDKKRLSVVNPLPSTILSKIKHTKKIVMMSGSFEPIHSFQRLFGLPSSEKLQLFPIKKENKAKYMILMNKKLNGRFDFRTQDYFVQMTRIIDRLFKAIPGHTIVFCPSYSYIKKLTEGYLLKPDIIEEPDMDISTVQTIIRNAKEKKLICCVVGGKISEGVEFTEKGKSLIKGVIVTTLPFPPPDIKNQMIKEELTKRYGDRFAIEFTVIIPTVQRLIQSFGRAIRSEKDRAVHILLDPRGTRFNKEFRFERYKSVEQMQRVIKSFFE